MPHKCCLSQRFRRNLRVRPDGSGQIKAKEGVHMHFFSKTLIAILTIPRCRGQLSGHIIPKKILVIVKKIVYIKFGFAKFVCSGQCVLTERFEASIIFTNIYFGGYGYQKMTGRLILFPCIRFACSCQQTLPQLFACLFFVESRRHKYPFPESIVP